MYETLFRKVTEAIDLLQEAQQQTEEIYIDDEPASRLIIMGSDNKAADKP
jgi:hypothetical protein